MKNNLIIISGPSGAGEDTVIDALSKLLPIERVITTTTREKRKGEKDGQPYYFVSREEFEAGIKSGRFFEYAKHYNDNYYGVTFDEIERVKKGNKIGLWKIDYKGVIKAKELMPEIKSIFIIAPLEVLEQRIRARSGVTEEYVRERMDYTREWLKHRDIYDYAVENKQDQIDETVQEVRQIIEEIIGGVERT